MRWISILLLLATATGCSTGRLRGHEPSTEKLTPEMIEFGNRLVPPSRAEKNAERAERTFDPMHPPLLSGIGDRGVVQDDPMEFSPLPYLTREPLVTNNYVDSFRWFLLWFKLQEFGKFEKSFGFYETEGICPVLFQTSHYLFDEEGNRECAQRTSAAGLLFPWPAFRILMVRWAGSRDQKSGDVHRDVALVVLELPVIKRKLLYLGTDGFEFLFFPFWIKDTSPPTDSETEPETGLETESGPRA